MAKKTAKKSKAAKPAPKKAAKKAGVKKPPASSDPGNPTPVSTGKGMSPMDMGKKLVEMYNRGEFEEIEQAFWSPKIQSIEGSTPAGPGKMWTGAKNVKAKGAHWMSQHTIHGTSAEGPFVGSTGFAVRFKMDVEVNATKQRIMFDEVGVYTVKDGKIVREEFMYGGMP